jgi:hypothetical protein
MAEIFAAHRRYQDQRADLFMDELRQRSDDLREDKGSDEARAPEE